MGQKNEILRGYKTKGKKLGKSALFLPLLLLKIFCLLVLSVLTPAIMFLLFISVEPREIGIINDYAHKIVKNKIGEDAEGIKAGKISFDGSFSIAYAVKNISLGNKHYQADIGSATFYINPFVFLSGRIKIKRIDFLETQLTLRIANAENLAGIKIDKTFLLGRIIDALSSENIFLVKKIYMTNGNFTLTDADGNAYDKFFIAGGVFTARSSGNRTKLNFTVNTRINEKSIIKSSNSCVIQRKNGVADCNFVFNNLFAGDILLLAKNQNRRISEYSKNIEGKYNVKIYAKISKEKGMEASNFVISSERGSLRLGDIFGDDVRYQNLIIEGGATDGGDSVDLSRISVAVATKKDSKYSLAEGNMSLRKGKSIGATIKLQENNVKNLDALWPVFLDQLDIREWVIEHVKSGGVGALSVFLDFNFAEDGWDLKNVEASFNFDNVLLNYSEDFPPISGMKGTAYFHRNDMKIQIKSAESDGSKISNGEIYINYGSSDTVYIDISAKLVGNPYYLGYYIDYKSRDRIKNIIQKYFNGTAKSDIRVMVPISDLDGFEILKLSSIDVRSDLTENNTFILGNGTLNVKKPLGSNVFDVKIDLTDSAAGVDFLSLKKARGKVGGVAASAEVNSDNVLIKNVRPLGDGDISFLGNGLAQGGELKELNIEGIKYGDFLYNLGISSGEDGKINISMNAERFRVNIPKNNYVAVNYYEMFRGVFDDDVNFSGRIKNLDAGKYKFSNVDFAADCVDGDINHITARSSDENFAVDVELTNKKAKEILDLTVKIKNFGYFLNNMNITPSVVGGNFYSQATANKNNEIKIRAKILDDFDIMIKNMKQAKFYRSLLDSEEVSKKFRKDLIENNFLPFSKMEANAELKDGELKIERFLFHSSRGGGMGFSGFGGYNLATGNIEVDGLIIPISGLNTLFGMN
ncbi:MAG: hypothetical protein LBB09_02200, partial [Rickettsiales bacterium]|nr:hypothetical protein [Rickettsiales bacterium]